jgi:guanine deaminase
MRRAIALALENARLGNGPFGAVITRGGKIISEGQNGVTFQKDPTAHAEIVAIREACKALDRFDLTGCEIYTSCEPCPMCLGGIYWARISRIYYAAAALDAAAVGFDDAKIYSEMGKPAEAREIPTTQMLRESAVQVFEVWKANPNKVEY